MKKVLFVAPDFFNYSEIIKEKLKEKGFDAEWFDDRPSKNLIDKCIIRVNKNLLKGKIKRYFYNKIYASMKEKKYDIIFVIGGQSFNRKMFEDLKTLSPESRFILYLWDSVKNLDEVVDFSKAFNETFSFDQYDCEKYGFKFLPLFYNEERKTDEIKYDVSFIGTIKKGKLPYINKIKKELDSQFDNNFFYLFLQSKIVFLYNKILNKEFRKAKFKDFVYKRMEYKTNNDIVLKSRFVLDVPMKNQDGLSMRTFECLGYHKKLITTNKNILNYDFYKPENIYYYDGNEIDFNNVFFNSDYQEIDEVILNKYSLDNWINQLFNSEV